MPIVTPREGTNNPRGEARAANYHWPATSRVPATPRDLHEPSTNGPAAGSVRSHIRRGGRRGSTLANAPRLVGQSPSAARAKRLPSRNLVVAELDGVPEEPLRVLPLPGAERVVSRYPIAITDKAPHGDAGARFVAVVRSDQGRAVLASYGFTLP